MEKEKADDVWVGVVRSDSGDLVFFFDAAGFGVPHVGQARPLKVFN